jgi:hypothetical protein
VEYGTVSGLAHQGANGSSPVANEAEEFPKFISRPKITADELENLPLSKKSELTLAIAKGTPVTTWANKNNVPRRTAFRWAREPKVRAAVEIYRRRVLDRAVGRMTVGVTFAIKGIFELAKSASSESVKLADLRAVVSDMMAVSKFGGLEDSLTQVEGKINARNGHTNRPR